MVWALIASLAIVFTNGAAPLKIPVPRTAGAAQFSQSSAVCDAEAERQLFNLANQARGQAGLPPLEVDQGLVQAARAHAASMAAQQQLSHQFPGEPSLGQRLAAETSLHLDHAGENVAFAGSAEQAAETMMQSPPHRENLLSPAYNMAGFGVMRSGETLYVVQDFGHGLPRYSAATSEEMVATAVNRMRSQNGLSTLQRLDGGSAQAMACSMAQADSLSTPTPQARYVLRYTGTELQGLPSDAGRAVGSRAVGAFSVGACYARTARYPNGAYWVVLLFY